MKTEERKQPNDPGKTPIRLDDLIPDKNVKGGKGKVIFGTVKRTRDLRPPLP